MNLNYQSHHPQSTLARSQKQTWDPSTRICHSDSFARVLTWLQKEFLKESTPTPISSPLTPGLVSLPMSANAFWGLLGFEP